MKKFYFLLLALCLFTSANAQIINIPDANFKAKLLAASTNLNVAQDSQGNFIKIDINNNNEIEVSEAQLVYELFLNGCQISDLTGILNFSNIRQMDVSYNTLTFLNLNGLTNLEILYCGSNKITSLDVSGLTNLQELSSNSNSYLTSLNCNGLANLKIIDCGYCKLPSLNLSLINLETLKCRDNYLLTTLDVSNCPKLVYLDCRGQYALTSLFIKNGSNETALEFGNSPNLGYICVDENQLVSVQNKVTTYGYTNCRVNSYCSFTPGGIFYTIQGNNKHDGNNNNNCDVTDPSLPNLKFSITNGTTSGNMISNTSGDYTIPVQVGSYTITPIFENPTYFTVTPPTANVNFPAQTSPFTQNFCVKANGVHPDLEVALLPATTARPGNDAKYKVVYKNKGNTTQSGTVNLVFNDAVLDFVLANPVVASQTTNNLSWDFTNLLPFETRIIDLVFNVNTPMEIPAVNGGDVLSYTATITSAATDDLPNDNTFTLNQIVVNSLDPNDKTCLEGTTITPSKVGEYVHYVIRFENSGTANAQNIVVKDMIDAAKFDLSSLVAMKGSHPFVTNITSGNKVEFIFENINLPFDDANNDGYVAFKIKTKPTLVNGDTFSNTASIYFDYNFPIVTNTTTTTVQQVLSVQDFEFSNYFSLYPNPVSDVLNISTKENIEITSINIYNTLGQLVLVIPNAKDIKTVDVSSLTSGNYFIKVHSDKGTSNTKFIKN